MTRQLRLLKPFCLRYLTKRRKRSETEGRELDSCYSCSTLHGEEISIDKNTRPPLIPLWEGGYIQRPPLRNELKRKMYLASPLQGDKRGSHNAQEPSVSLAHAQKWNTDSTDATDFIFSRILYCLLDLNRIFLRLSARDSSSWGKSVKINAPDRRTQS